jgi:hypothetical protein
MKERATGPTGSTGSGWYWVKTDIPTVPMFTNDADETYQIGRSYVTYTMGGRYTGTTADTWFSFSGQTHGSTDGNAATTGGSGATPIMTYNYQGEMLPKSGTVLQILLKYNINVASDGYFDMYLATPTDDSATVGLVEVFSHSVSGKNINVANLVDSGALSVSVAKFDQLRLWSRAGATTQWTSAIASANVLIELD